MRATPCFLFAAVSLLLASCGGSATKAAEPTETLSAERPQPPQRPEPQASPPAPPVNPLLAEWTGPYGGVPAFDSVELSDLRPAAEQAMAEEKAELEAIAQNPEPPTFDNTIIAMERSGKAMERLWAYFGVWSANLSTPELRELQMELAPRFSAHQTEVVQNQPLFARVKAVYESDELERRSAEEQRLVQLVYDRFARQGAELQGEDKDRYRAIQERLSTLHTQFGNNVLADEESYVVYLDASQLGGLPESLKTAAASAAAERGKEGQWAILNTRSSMDPFLTYSTERKLREKVWRNYYNRGDNGDEHDNNAIIAEILQLRDERVALLGYDNYAQWRLADRMAKRPENADKLMKAVWRAAVARAKVEVRDMQRLARRQGDRIAIQPWDYRYYANKVQKARYDFDREEVKQYLQLDKLREAMFMVAERVFKLRFTPVPDGKLPVFHTDVKVWEVSTLNDAHVGLWYLDPFARQGKRSGAWATSYRSHTTIDGETNVLASNNSNFIKGAPGEPVLVSWDDATTFFHEFGHALHFLSSRVDYPTLNGGVRDYTEFQSQLLERWLFTDEVIDNYLVHHETDEPIPAKLVEQIKKASNFNQGFATTEYLASALVNMAFHTVDPAGIDPDAFEKRTLAKLGLPDQIVMRHRSPHFGHIFSGEGYSAGYYGYLWAEVLTADAAEAFAEAPGGFYDPEVSKKLVDHLFAPRNAVDPAEAYRAFRGRDATIDALMRDRGFRK